MRTYCRPLLAACENRAVAMVRNTIWTISTHSAVVLLLLSELQQRLAGQPRAWMGSHVRAYMQHVAAAAEYSSSRGVDVMGDGPQLR